MCSYESVFEQTSALFATSVAQNPATLAPLTPIDNPEDFRQRGLLHQLDLVRTPCFREERFQWAVETQDGKPTFFLIGLNPVASLHAVGLRRAEVDRRRTVGGRLRCGRVIALAASVRVVLRGVEHRAGHVVVDGERPEVRLGDPLRQRDFLGLRAVEVFLVRIRHVQEILRSDARQAHVHGGRDVGDAVEERGARIQLPIAGGREGF